MAKKVILGTDIARDAFKTKVNDNFTELYDKDVALGEQINHLDADIVAHKAESANKAHGGFKGALIRLGTNQSIPSADYTPVIFSNALYDTNGFYSSSYPSRLTVPKGITKVRLYANSYWADAGENGVREIVLWKNGALVTPRFADRRNANGFTQANVITPMLKVGEGHYFELVVYQNSGAAINFGGNVGMAWFGIEVVE